MHLFGIAYKRDVNDMRESPALDILELLSQRGADVSYTDPFVPTMTHAGHTLDSVPFERAIATAYDCSVVATDHSSFDYSKVASMPLVVDTRNAIKTSHEHVFRL